MAIIAGSAHAQNAGRFVELGPVASPYVSAQNVVIWLPPGYAEGRSRYPVVYMHDGQNLFFPKRSNFNKVWAADKSAARLIAAKRVKPFIIVGIDQPGEARGRQYFPQALYETAAPPLRTKFDAFLKGAPYSDAYLRFIVEVLKPQIDREFRTKADRDSTAVIGSSMGGLVSCYAMTRYPAVFGRAACVSTHWPMSIPSAPGAFDADIAKLWTDHLAQTLGPAHGRRIWFDHGTATLDAFYAPYQKRIDAQMDRLGWKRGRDFESRVYQGAEHEENAWAARMDDVFGWLMR